MKLKTIRYRDYVPRKMQTLESEKRKEESEKKKVEKKAIAPKGEGERHERGMAQIRDATLYRPCASLEFYSASLLSSVFSFFLFVAARLRANVKAKRTSRAFRFMSPRRAEDLETPSIFARARALRKFTTRVPRAQYPLSGFHFYLRLIRQSSSPPSPAMLRTRARCYLSIFLKVE